MLDQLITSRTRSKILELFLAGPDIEIHLREISRKINENYNSTRRELNHLEELQILTSRKDGNQKYFRINKAHIIYLDLKNIYLKTAGIGNAIRNHLEEIGNVRFCFIYGSYASNTEKADSDLDLFIVGNVEEKILIPVINNLEKQLNRDINYILYTPDEYLDRVKRGDRFVMNVLEGKKIMLWGDEDGLRRT